MPPDHKIRRHFPNDVHANRSPSSRLLRLWHGSGWRLRRSGHGWLGRSRRACLWCSSTRTGRCTGGLLGNWRGRLLLAVRSLKLAGCLVWNLRLDERALGVRFTGCLVELCASRRGLLFSLWCCRCNWGLSDRGDDRRLRCSWSRCGCWSCGRSLGRRSKLRRRADNEEPKRCGCCREPESQTVFCFVHGIHLQWLVPARVIALEVRTKTRRRDELLFTSSIRVVLADSAHSTRPHPT
jgi:hypothetical protein